MVNNVPLWLRQRFNTMIRCGITDCKILQSGNVHCKFILTSELWANEFSVQVQLPGWLMMSDDEFQLALRYTSILETEAINNRCELKLDCFTYRIEVLPDLG